MFPGFVRLPGTPRINLQTDVKGSDFPDCSEGQSCLWPVADNQHLMSLLGPV